MGTGIQEIVLHGNRVGRAVPARRNAKTDALSWRDRDIAPYLLLLGLSVLICGCKPGTPKAGDHAHPMCWENAPMSTCTSILSDGEVEKTRYQGGANYTFVDGHAKYIKLFFNPGNIAAYTYDTYGPGGIPPNYDYQNAPD